MSGEIVCSCGAVEDEPCPYGRPECEPERVAALRADLAAERERADALAGALRKYGRHHWPVCTCGLDAVLSWVPTNERETGNPKPLTAADLRDGTITLDAEASARLNEVLAAGRSPLPAPPSSVVRERDAQTDGGGA